VSWTGIRFSFYHTRTGSDSGSRHWPWAQL